MSRSVPGGILSFAFSYFTTSDGALDYIPFGHDAESSLITSGATELQCPIVGEIVGVLVYATADCGPLVCGLHLNGNTTASDTQTIDPGAALASMDFNLLRMAVSRNDRVAVSLDATVSPTLHRVTVIFRGS